ncbi:50S ribosomal protein L24 [Candidatus Woesearchaeota archaeon CG10_big_fil_rev_8_21_14_0_10_44_13]|nr:MAG: 50S ribosomal protein L24 [Candidatus Woesearchaeota archaeon CG10_big_fil_rev_8_21_14_0_10_44_13]
MPKCSFCGENLRRGTGKMFVHTDGRIAYFCSMKCEKNMLKLRRNPNTTVWTKRFSELKGSSKQDKKEQKPQPEKKEAKKEKPKGK